MIKKIIILIVLIGCISQFFKIDKTNPIIVQNNDFTFHYLTQKPDIAKILDRACNDCHSNNTVYPWYSNIAPISWWIKHHVDEGRLELNFSEWATYSEKRKKHKIEECIAMIQENKMPLKSYTWSHADAILNETDKNLLLVFFKSLLTNLNNPQIN